MRCSSLTYEPSVCLIQEGNASYQKCPERKASLEVHKHLKRGLCKSRLIFERERPNEQNRECRVERGGKTSFVLRVKKSGIRGYVACHKKSSNFVQKLKKEKDSRLQKELSSVIKRMVKVSIAHGMDPVQRAGQTSESNAREASKYGRKAKGKRGFFASFFKLLLKLFFLMVFPIVSFKDILVDCILKVWEDKHKKGKQRKRRPSFVERIFRQRHSTILAR